MKVSNNKNAQDQVANANQTGAAKKTQNAKPKSMFDPVQPEAAESTADSAKVQLSERVQDMKKIREAVNKTPDVDEAKVAKLRAMIAKGEYKTDSKKIADKMVDEYAYNGLLSDE